MLNFKANRDYDGFAPRSITKVVSVWLGRNDGKDMELFRCYSCSQPIIQYGGDVIQIVAGPSPSKLPFIVECRNKYCDLKFQFNSVV